MSKYIDLRNHLANLNQEEWQASFADIEDILGFALPQSAYNYPAWWSNQGEGHTQSFSWQSAGWKTTKIDLQARTVTFVRAEKSSKSLTRQYNKPLASLPETPLGITALTIDEAKAGLAKNFGVSSEAIEITIRA